jgi:hypothetical protein
MDDMASQTNGYMIVEAGDLVDLTNRVSDWMRQGWRPVGGPVVYQGMGGRIVIQAVFRVEEPRH